MYKKFFEDPGKIPSNAPREYIRADISNVIRELTEIFNRDKPPYLEIIRLDSILFKYNVSKSELVKTLQGNQRFYYENQKIYRKNKYDIKNSNDLFELLKNRKEGIEDNQDLYDCYLSCKNDIEKLKKKGSLRVIENKNEKKTYLFLKDEKYDFKDFQDVAEKIKRKWNEAIEKEYAIKTQETEIKNKGKNLKKKARRRKNRVINNTWMKGVLDFREMNDDN
jgi:hypothetical protein